MSWVVENWVLLAWNLAFAWGSLRAVQITMMGLVGVSRARSTGENGDLRVASVLIIAGAARGLVVAVLCLGVGLLSFVSPSDDEVRSLVEWVAVWGLLGMAYSFSGLLEYEYRVRRRL